MKRLLQKILSLLLAPSLALAMDTPIIFGGNQAPSSSVTQYTSPIGFQPAFNASESIRRLVIPTSGTIYNLQVTDSGSSTGNYTYTLYKNGSSTLLTCNDSGANCRDITHTVSVSPGDTISLQSTPNSPDAIYTNFQGTLMFNSTTSAEGLIMGASLGNVASGYYPIQSVSNGNATLNLTQAVMPTSGVIDHLYIDLQTAPGNPGDGVGWVVAVTKNGAGSGLGLTIVDASTSQADLVNSVSYAAGDLIAISVIPQNAPANSQMRWGVRWKPTTDGESVQLYGNASLGTASSTQYAGVSDGVSGAINSTENNRIQMVQAATIKKLYTNINIAPGVGNSVAFTVMAKKTPSALTCSISGGSATSCNDTSNSYSTALGDTIDMKLVKVSVPVNDGVGTGIVTFITPPTPTNTAIPAGGYFGGDHRTGQTYFLHEPTPIPGAYLNEANR